MTITDQPTPGPWKVGGKKTISRDHPDKSMQVVVARADSAPTARLIAAAPELLEAALDFVAKVERGEARSVRSYAKFKAAIAKAQGE